MVQPPDVTVDTEYPLPYLPICKAERATIFVRSERSTMFNSTAELCSFSDWNINAIGGESDFDDGDNGDFVAHENKEVITTQKIHSR